MKLISMTDLVLAQKDIWNGNENAFFEVGKASINYAEFLQKPIKLEMFVPCDEKGNPLPEPKMRPERNSFDEEDMDYDAQELHDYIKAKEKVLFKKFEYTEDSDFDSFTEDYSVSKETLSLFEGKNIEFLIEVFEEIEIIESVKKQIGL